MAKKRAKARKIDSQKNGLRSATYISMMSPNDGKKGEKGLGAAAAAADHEATKRREKHIRSVKDIRYMLHGASLLMH